MMTDIPGSLIDPAIPRVALVTGGAKRVGRAMSLALASAGFAIAIHCHESRDEAEALCATIDRQGGRATTLAADLSNEAEAACLLDRAAAALGPVGVLVNNASRFDRDEWDTVTEESWNAHMSANLRAPFVLMQAFGRMLPPDRNGAIVNMLDERVWSLTPHFVSYTVAKAGLWALTQSMALALAPRIRVNGIGPGPALPSTRQTDAQFDRQCRSVPLGRGTSPEEIARALLGILAFPAMTGQMIALDGGQHLQWHPHRLSSSQLDE